MLCLFVRAGAERLAVPAAAVVEVVPAVRLHRPAGAPTRVAGVLRFRGEVTPVLDVHQLTTGEPCPERLSTRIVILEADTPAGRRRLGLLAERVTDLKSLAEIGPAYAGPATGGPDLGPMAVDADGVVRLTEVARLFPLAYPADPAGVGR